jgi:prepilin-type N-terminal cleavage/methylation domain-containing protein
MRGYTLIEVMIIITIMAILAAIIAPIIAGCDRENVRTVDGVRIRTIDGCEYIEEPGKPLVHKGNCAGCGGRKK